MVAREGFEPSFPKDTDLQSAKPPIAQPRNNNVIYSNFKSVNLIHQLHPQDLYNDP